MQIVGYGSPCTLARVRVMPKQKTAGNGAAKAKSAKPDRPSGAPKSPVEMVRDCADALFRAADECCYQHDRISRILTKSTVEAELNPGDLQ